jgi:hypothetical protein
VLAQALDRACAARCSRTSSRRSPVRALQTGSGTLPVLLILLLALALMQLYSQRALIFEQRAVANQVRAAWATEAGEAGIAWTLAQLNRSGNVDANCMPLTTSATNGSSLRERLLGTDADSGALRVAAAGAACVLDDGWRCNCPAGGAASLATPADTRNHPAFSMQLQEGPAGTAQNGLVRLVITGCSHLGLGCGGTTPVDARTEIRSLLAPYGQLLHPPAATITALGGVTIGPGVTLVNGDAGSGGLTVQSAATVTTAPTSRLFGPPGRPAEATLVANEPALGIDSDTLWRRYFGVSANSVRDLPTTHRVPCPLDGCGAADVQAALDAGHRSLWLDGDLRLATPVRWGNAERGVLLLIDGAAHLQGPLEIDALLLARSITWQPGASGVTRLRGALISLGAVELQGSAEIVRDRTLLDRLHHAAGAYAVVPGSWQDFVN